MLLKSTFRDYHVLPLSSAESSLIESGDNRHDLSQIYGIYIGDELICKRCLSHL